MTDNAILSLAMLGAMFGVLAILLAMVVVACLIPAPGAGWESFEAPRRPVVAGSFEKALAAIPEARAGHVRFLRDSTVHTPFAGQEPKA